MPFMIIHLIVDANRSMCVEAQGCVVIVYREKIFFFSIYKRFKRTVDILRLFRI